MTLNQIISDRIENYIQQGVNFISANQLPWGELANYSIDENSNSRKKYCSMIFPTVFTMKALTSYRSCPGVEAICKKAEYFVLDSKDGDFLHYFNKNNNLPPDLDTTSCSYSFLLSSNYKIGHQILDKLKELREPSSRLFFTWVNPPQMLENDIDVVVNANAFLLFVEENRGDEISEVLNFLTEEIGHLPTLGSQLWYHSPIIFCYIFSKIINCFPFDNSDKVTSTIIEFLLFKQDRNGSWRNPLETSFALTTLLNFNFFGKEVDNGIKYLLNQRNQSNGSWGMEFIFPVGGGGSAEITTAFCIETLSKYSGLYQKEK